MYNSKNNNRNYTCDRKSYDKRNNYISDRTCGDDDNYQDFEIRSADNVTNVPIGGSNITKSFLYFQRLIMIL